jgi:hypothetical protein
MAYPYISYTTYVGGWDAPRADRDFALPSPRPGARVGDEAPLYAPLLRWLREDWLLGLAAIVALCLAVGAFEVSQDTRSASAATARETRPTPAMLTESEAAATFEGHGADAAVTTDLVPADFDRPPESVQLRPTAEPRPAAVAAADADASDASPPADADASSSDTTQP